MRSSRAASGRPYLGGPGWSVWAAAFVVAAVVSTALMAAGRGQWLGWWPATWGGLQVLDVWGAPLAAVSGAWVAAQPRRFGFDEWCAAGAVGRGWQRGRAVVFAASAVGAGQLVGIGYACAQTWALAAGTRHYWLWLVPLTLFASVVVWAGIGVWLGGVLPLWVALPAAVAVPYGVSLWMALDGLDTPLAGLAVANFTGNVELVPRPVVTGLRALTWVLLAVAVLVMLAGSRGRLRRMVLPALSAATASVVWVGLPLIAVPGARDVECRYEAPVVCVSRPYLVVAGTFHRQLVALWPDVPTAMRTEYVVAPDVEVEWRQRRPLVGYLLVGPASRNTLPAFVADPSRTATGLADALFDVDAPCPDAQVSLQLVAARQWWLREHGGAGEEQFGIPLDYSSAEEYAAALDREVTGLKGLDRAGRDGWFSDLTRRSRAAGCQGGR